MYVQLISNFQIRSVVSEKYDYNTFDDSGIVGPHPYHNNLYIAAGFGRLGKILQFTFVTSNITRKIGAASSSCGKQSVAPSHWQYVFVF